MNEPQNPYAAPAAKLAQREDPRALTDAGKGQRFGTVLIDYVCYYVLVFVVSFLAALIGGPSVIEYLQRFSLLVAVIVLLAYYQIFEGLLARTPGKFICGTRVITEDGRAPGMLDVLKRTLCRFIPFEAFSFFGDRGWHDSLSRTRVVRTRG